MVSGTRFRMDVRPSVYLISASSMLISELPVLTGYSIVVPLISPFADQRSKVSQIFLALSKSSGVSIPTDS